MKNRDFYCGCMGKTGVGKPSGLLLPELLKLDIPAVVVDVKGECSRPEGKRKKGDGDEPTPGQ
jgi:hypothetical protein